MPASDQGVSFDRYMLVPRVLIFVRRGEALLLLKGAPGKRLWAGKYNGVGGHVEAGEDLLAAARRELLEETGLSSDLRLVGTLTVDTGRNPGVGLFVFSGEWTGGEPRASAEGSLEWVRPADLPGLPVLEDLPILVGRLLSMAPGDPPFSARSYYDPGGKQVIEFMN